MKKIILLIIAISISIGAIAQKGKVTAAQSFIDQGALDKAKEAIDQALTNEKSNTWSNTFFTKGNLCRAIYDADNPAYNSFYADPLAEAYASYEKAMELDPKGGIKKKIIAQLIYNSMVGQLSSQGAKKFEAKDFEGAFNSFITQVKITESGMYAGNVDTGMYFNTALAAINAKKFNEAIKYFEKCAEMKYLGLTPYLQISQCYLGLGDTAKAENYLLNLKDKFPEDNNVFITIADFYLKSNRPIEALNYIEISKKKDPSNYGLYYAAGVTYLNQNRFDEAIADLTKSVELKSDLYESQYALGASYINKAAAMLLKANDEMDINKFNVLFNEANNVYAQAIPYMEKALELKPDDIYTMKSLGELYYRLKATGNNLEKYNAIKARISAIENK
jgi:tetratricopeptide (TPR) repeat protein